MSSRPARPRSSSAHLHTCTRLASSCPRLGGSSCAAGHQSRILRSSRMTTPRSSPSVPSSKAVFREWFRRRSRSSEVSVSRSPRELSRRTTAVIAAGVASGKEPYRLREQLPGAADPRQADRVRRLRPRPSTAARSIQRAANVWRWLWDASYPAGGSWAPLPVCNSGSYGGGVFVPMKDASSGRATTAEAASGVSRKSPADEVRE